MNQPAMTLQLSIEPLVKKMVCAMLLDESQVREAIEAAVAAAVANFDWAGQISEAVKREIQEQVTSSMRTLIPNVFWDEQVRKDFRKAVAKALSE